MPSLVSLSGAVGAFGSLLSTIILIVAVSIPDFVNVYIPADVQNPTAGSPLASVGVFTTSYDSENIDPALVLQSGVPADTFSTPTTSFPLLFPSQENFIADVLPLNAQTVAAIDAATSGAATAVIGDQLAPVQNAEFEDCESFLVEQTQNVQDLFSNVTEDFLPGLIKTLFAPSLNQVDTRNALAQSLSGDASTNLIAASVLETFGTLSDTFGLIDACDGLTFDANTAIDAGLAGCLAQAYGFVANDPSQEGLTAALFGGVAARIGTCVGISFTACISGIDFVLQDTRLSDVVAFANDDADEPDNNDNFCVLLGQACQQGTITKLDLLQRVFALWQDNEEIIPNEDFFDALSKYLGAVKFGIIETELTFADAVQLNEAFPEDNFNQTFYKPCALLQLLELPGTPPNPGTCPFGSFFELLATFLGQNDPENPLIETLGLINNLFQLCKTSHDDAQVTVGPGACSDFFTYFFLSGSFGRSLDISPIFLGLSAPIDTQALAECEDDEIDLQKVGQAQVLIIAGIATSVISGLMGGVGSVASRSRGSILTTAAAMSFASAGLVLGSLLVVQSAPIFASVGEDPEIFEPFFDLGNVSLLALVSVGLQAVVGLEYLVGAVVAACQPTVNEVPENKEEAVEKPQEHATGAELDVKEAVAIEEEPKPSV